ncbi:hypothetical protein MRX96_011738 [Rhipicephalus microplus]|uniref:Uncharacterized protein n=1 Tax=Rhipicephalus microplus TaxID=6941 RepID=A0A9J6DJ49_RHIMP|nr:hypothetical protein HPB51_018759 [Rhipicephalus microplus]
MKRGPLFVAFVVLLVLFIDAAYGMDDLVGLLSDRVDSVTNMARAFLAVFVGAFTINACVVVFIVFGDGRSRRFLFPLVVIYAALYLVFGGLAYLFLGLSGTVADRVRTLGSIMDTVSVGDVSDSAFSYMKVHEHDCRLRFVCELSEKAVQRDHMFALVLRIVSVLGSAGGPYVEAVLGGLSGRGCHLLFADCDYSPLRRSLPFLD